MCDIVVEGDFSYQTHTFMFSFYSVLRFTLGQKVFNKLLNKRQRKYRIPGIDGNHWLRVENMRRSQLTDLSYREKPYDGIFVVVVASNFGN